MGEKSTVWKRIHKEGDFLAWALFRGEENHKPGKKKRREGKAPRGEGDHFCRGRILLFFRPGGPALAKTGRGVCLKIWDVVKKEVSFRKRKVLGRGKEPLYHPRESRCREGVLFGLKKEIFALDGTCRKRKNGR